MDGFSCGPLVMLNALPVATGTDPMSMVIQATVTAMKQARWAFSQKLMKDYKILSNRDDQKLFKDGAASLMLCFCQYLFFYTYLYSFPEYHTHVANVLH